MPKLLWGDSGEGIKGHKIHRHVGMHILCEPKKTHWNYVSRRGSPGTLFSKVMRKVLARWAAALPEAECSFIYKPAMNGRGA